MVFKFMEYKYDIYIYLYIYIYILDIEPIHSKSNNQPCGISADLSHEITTGC